MKSLKMLMMAGLTILTISVYAQNNSTLSKKEQMKMEVMKSSASPVQYNIPGDTQSKISKKRFAVNRSSKEQMKLSVMNGNSDTLYQDGAAACPLCLAVLNATTKEQMKLKVMGLYTCPMKVDTASNQRTKCSRCGMNLNTATSK